MKRVLLAVFFLSAPAFAQSPADYYKQLAGTWESASGNFMLNYSVDANRVRVKGETCAESTHGPQTCGFIDQDYVWKSAALMREYSAYGQLPVEIVELTPTKLTKREPSPVARDQASVTTEELLDPETMQLTSEVWVSGQTKPRSRVVVTLKRSAGTGASTSVSSGFGLIVQ